MEMIRVKHGLIKPGALLSRSIAGVSGTSLVYCLPGSVKAVEEYCPEILPTITHSLKMILGISDHSDYSPLFNNSLITRELLPVVIFRNQIPGIILAGSRISHNAFVGPN
jgi:hypothetical protein